MAPIKAVIVGAGHRAVTYASYSERYPDELKIVGVADPIALRRKQMAERFGFGEEACFETAQDLANAPKFADVVINGTMDHQHVDTAVPLLETGYDMLLEKPFATNTDEMWHLADVAKKNNRRVMICHVLRYAPFYAAIREKVAQGVIGKVMNVQTIEHVSYHHMGVAFVRGKWNRKDLCHSSMLMAKCCHDLDLIMWMMSGINPVQVSSFGSNMYFNEAHAPKDAGTRCMVDCPIEEECLYSAKKHYIDHPKRWSFYVWDTLEHIENPTLEQKIESLKTTNPYGRCVWKCDNDVVDHQSVAIEFENGATATHNMVGGTAKPSRAIHLLGTEGEIQGVFEDSRFVIRHIDPRPGCEYAEEEVDLKTGGDMHGAFGGHGGGDLRLVGDFVKLVRGEETSLSCTVIDDSINGHWVGFCADESMDTHQVVQLKSKG